MRKFDYVGPFVHNTTQQGVIYKVLVHVEDGRVQVFANESLTINRTIEQLPETLKWNLVCTMANDPPDKNELDGDYLHSVPIMSGKFAPKGFEQIGWRAGGSTYFIVVPEQELIDFIRPYLE